MQQLYQITPNANGTFHETFSEPAIYRINNTKTPSCSNAHEHQNPLYDCQIHLCTIATCRSFSHALPTGQDMMYHVTRSPFPKHWDSSTR